MTGSYPNKLKLARESRMFSKAELARVAGISPLTIGRVESGFSSRLSTKRKLLEALEIDLNSRADVFPELAH